MKPNKENIRKWVDALRSGNYEQTTNCLADRFGYCCLGVACEVAIANRVEIHKKVFNGIRVPNMISYDGMVETLPDSVCRFFVVSTNPKLIHDRWNNYVSLSELNDGGFTFPQIADIIEWAYL